MAAQAAPVITDSTPLWYATRATGVISLLLLSASLVLGIAVRSRAANERWPRLVISGIHRNISLLVCAFLAVHIVTAAADSFAPVGWWAVAIPFASAYRPVWLGFGTVAADLLVALVVSSLLRPRIGLRIWRLIHWCAYLCWPAAVVHGLGTGTVTALDGNTVQAGLTDFSGDFATLTLAAAISGTHLGGSLHVAASG